MILKINNLTKKFDQHIVLDDVSISLEDIESIVVIGASGGGKTTLLRILGGLTPMTSGEVQINDHILNSYDKNGMREYRKKIGMVFQAYNLFPHLSALQNIILPLTKIHKLSKEEAEHKAIELLDRFQLKPHMSKRPYQLSGGQQQRIAISRAVAINPEFLLLDEPTSALDPEMTSEVIDILKDLRAMHIQFIMVTHNINLAKGVADYMVFMNEAKIEEHKPADEFFNNPESAALLQFLDKVISG